MTRSCASECSALALPRRSPFRRGNSAQPATEKGEKAGFKPGLQQLRTAAVLTGRSWCIWCTHMAIDSVEESHSRITKANAAQGQLTSLRLIGLCRASLNIPIATLPLPVRPQGFHENCEGSIPTGCSVCGYKGNPARNRAESETGRGEIDEVGSRAHCRRH